LPGQFVVAPGALGYFGCVHRAGKKIENRVAVMAKKFVYRHLSNPSRSKKIENFPSSQLNSSPVFVKPE
jgi:hypothetical protein